MAHYVHCVCHLMRLIDQSPRLITYKRLPGSRFVDVGGQKAFSNLSYLSHRHEY